MQTSSKDCLLQVSCHLGFYDIVRLPEYTTEIASNLPDARCGCPRVAWTQTRARCGPNAGTLRVRRGQSRRKTRARRGQTQCQVISWRYCSFKPLLFFILIVDTIMSVSRRTLNRLSTLSNQDIQRLATNISTTE